MDAIKIFDLKETILADNDADADKLRSELKEKKVFYMNLMSSPGSGKTTFLLSTIKRLKEKINIGIMEADIDSDVDARTIRDEGGVESIQVHTGGMCHLDADMSRQGLREMDCQNLDLVVLENVGNLVCPAEFDTGAVKNVVILSISEGDDKPLKYPLIFKKCDVVVISKIDAAEVFDFDFDKVRANIAKVKENPIIFPVSAVTGEGMDAWCDWLLKEVKEWNANE